jgi:hypothetical protein
VQPSWFGSPKSMGPRNPARLNPLQLFALMWSSPDVMGLFSNNGVHHNFKNTRMPADQPHQVNRVQTAADLTYTMNLNVVKIQGTGKRGKTVADDLAAVLKKIENWHQGSIAGYRISCQDTQGLEYQAEWDRKQGRVRS